MEHREEVAAFAASIRALVTAVPVPDVWTPDTPRDDRVPELHDGLASIGWFDLADDPEALPFVGPAAAELGRAIAPVSLIDGLLGGSPLVGSLARYAAQGDPVMVSGPDGCVLRRVGEARPLPYIDALAVHRVLIDERSGEDRVEPERVASWIVASTGYLAGLADRATDLAVEYASQRIAFGKPLTAIDAVASKLADARTLADGLLLAAREHPSCALLAYAGLAACTVVGHCHQVVGATGFTLEYPLQRYSRRARAMQLWNDAALEALEPAHEPAGVAA